VSPSAGYIYITNWDHYQHGHKRGYPWFKMYPELLHNDRFLRLSLAERGLFECLLMCASESGDGRVSAERTMLGRRLNVRRVSLEPLIQAGFIEVRATRALSERSQAASTDREGSKEPKRESAASSARRNGAARRRHQKHLDTAVATAQEWKLEDDPDHLERDVRETWPDAADFILARVSSIPEQNGENGFVHEKTAPQEPTSAPRADDRDQPVEDIDDMDIPF
jgi:hypothetical protein